MENILKTTETKAQYKKQQPENKSNRWGKNPLHGQLLGNIDGKHDHTNSSWTRLKLLLKGRVLIVSKSIPGDPNVKEKKREKIAKYKDLKIKIKYGRRKLKLICLELVQYQNT